MLDYRKSQPGDHAPAECRLARAVYDRLPNYADAGGYHAGWGICAGTVAPTGSGGPSPFVRRALANELPAKDLGR